MRAGDVQIEVSGRALRKYSIFGTVFFWFYLEPQTLGGPWNNCLVAGAGDPYVVPSNWRQEKREFLEISLGRGAFGQRLYWRRSHFSCSRFNFKTAYT